MTVSGTTEEPERRSYCWNYHQWKKKIIHDWLKVQPETFCSDGIAKHVKRW